MRVILSKNLESVACTIWVGLHSFYTLIFHCTFVPFWQNLEIFCLSFSSLAFGGFFSSFLLLFSFIAAQLHVCVVGMALLTGLAVVPTQGLYFVFASFLFVFRKQIFGSEGVAKDKIVFAMLKHGHVSFQILTQILLQFGFWDKILTTRP